MHAADARAGRPACGHGGAAAGRRRAQRARRGLAARTGASPATREARPLLQLAPQSAAVRLREQHEPPKAVR